MIIVAINLSISYIKLKVFKFSNEYAVLLLKKLVSDNDGWTLRWEPMWKHCTPCVEGYPYQFIVKIEHIDQDLDYIMHDVLNIRNETDNTAMKINPYWDDEVFQMFRDRYPSWIYDGFAKDNMEVVKR